MMYINRKSFYIVCSSAFVGICFNLLKTVLHNNLTHKIHTICIDLQIVKNYSYILGILSESPFIISLLQTTTVSVSLYMLYSSSKYLGKIHFAYILSPWLMFSGFLGNAIDWFYRGYIIDYLKINIPHNIFYTNLEDIFIETGSILFIIQLLFRNSVVERIYKKG